jgi:2-desacetyl-2-hydroxyethyl bacteriochlorophyllide A dehydrogenase
VTINPYLACGTCIACRKAKPNACVNIKVLGVHVDGGMCDMLVVPESAVIDADGLTLDQAAMVEFLAVGAHAVARAPAAGVERMLVVGAGPIGIATALFGRLRGFEVSLADRRQPRLDFARDRLGFDGVPADDGLEAVLGQHTHGDMFDLVVDATGSLPAMRRSLGLTAHGGTLVFVGVALGDLTFEDSEFHKREATLVASRNALPVDFECVIAAIKSGDIPTDELQTQNVDAEELPACMPDLIASADSVLKAIASF